MPFGMSNKMKLPASYQAVLRTPFGVVGIHCANQTLTGISFLASNSKVLSPSDAFAREVCAQLQGALKNQVQHF